MLQKLFLSCLLALTSLLSCQGQEDKAADDALRSVHPEAIKATMSFLADDLLQGRQPGTGGFALASRYVQTEFMKLGLKPAMPDGSYAQRLTLKKAIVDESGCGLTLIDQGKEDVLTYGKEFIVSPYFSNERSEVTGELVFIGYGIHAPEIGGYDDYQNIDVKGKIVVFVTDAPETFPSNERAYFTSPAVKYGEAVRRGAVGAILLNMPGSRGSFESSLNRARQGSYKCLDNNGAAMDAFDALKGVSFLNKDYAEKIFVRSGRSSADVFSDLKAGKFHPLSLHISAVIKVRTKYMLVESSNLVGIIPGSDPKLKDEYVVYTAHLDHFGVGAVVNKDSIYNGAHDDASGVAIVLEIARAFRALKVPPKRSVMITVVTGEELGLLGSDYFIHNPPVKKEQIVANLTLDMPFFFHPVLDIVPYGSLHSSLSRQVERTAGILHLKIGLDPFPEQVVFIRSDHFSFIKQGIPALFIKSGFMTVGTDTVDRSKSDVDWRRTTYHTPKDDMNQAFDFDAAVTHVKINFLIGYFVCNDPMRPGWNKGDFFGGKFAARP